MVVCCCSKGPCLHHYAHAGGYEQNCPWQLWTACSSSVVRRNGPLSLVSLQGHFLLCSKPGQAESRRLSRFSVLLPFFFKQELSLRVYALSVFQFKLAVAGLKPQDPPSRRLLPVPCPKVGAHSPTPLNPLLCCTAVCPQRRAFLLPTRMSPTFFSSVVARYLSVL